MECHGRSVDRNLPKSPMIMEMAYSFGQAACGLVDTGFLGFAQLDMYGNANTTMIGDNFLNPKVRLTGSGGNNDVGSLCEKLVFVVYRARRVRPEMRFYHHDRTYVDGVSRKDLGILGGGPWLSCPPPCIRLRPGDQEDAD